MATSEDNDYAMANTTNEEITAVDMSVKSVDSKYYDSSIVLIVVMLVVLAVGTCHGIYLRVRSGQMRTS